MTGIQDLDGVPWPCGQRPRRRACLLRPSPCETVWWSQAGGTGLQRRRGDRDQKNIGRSQYFAPKSSPRFSRLRSAILRTFHGIIIADATAVSVNLERVVATFRRMHFQKHENLGAILAHGLAELAHWIFPGLLADFDIDRPFPWDGGYYRWLHRKNRSTRYKNMSAYSALLHQWIHDLVEPDWWYRPADGE